MAEYYTPEDFRQQINATTQSHAKYLQTLTKIHYKLTEAGFEPAMDPVTGHIRYVDALDELIECNRQLGEDNKQLKERLATRDATIDRKPTETPMAQFARAIEIMSTSLNNAMNKLREDVNQAYQQHPPHTKPESLRLPDGRVFVVGDRVQNFCDEYAIVTAVDTLNSLIWIRYDDAEDVDEQYYADGTEFFVIA